MTVRFEIDISELEELEEKFKLIPDHTEELINDYLHQEAVEMTKLDIRQGMPISNVKKKKPHAKLSKSLRHKTFNLGFEISPYPRFSYLVFPDQGLGTSYKKAPQHFMEKGLEISTEKILRELTERIDNKIKEVLS